jgi:hypothetical protein
MRRTHYIRKYGNKIINGLVDLLAKISTRKRLEQHTEEFTNQT